MDSSAEEQIKPGINVDTRVFDVLEITPEKFIKLTLVDFAKLAYDKGYEINTEQTSLGFNINLRKREDSIT